MIRLRGCAGWSAPLLFAYDIRHIFSWPGSYLFLFLTFSKGYSVYLVFISVYFLSDTPIVFRRRRRTKRKDPRHFAHHQLSPHSDSSLSKHSTLSQPDPRMVDPRDPRLVDPRDPRLVNPRLPKVGSSNLWFGTPSLYSGGPSEAYQGMRKTSSSRPPPPTQPALQGAYFDILSRGQCKAYERSCAFIED